jgi:hypothetical protein
MHKIIRACLIIVLILIMQSCIDPVNLENDKEVKVLVVEGGITSEYGPHNITLSNSAKYGDIFSGLIKPELGADILIRDNLGNVVELTEAANGLYQTPVDFKGEIGSEYILIIQRSNGKEYMSLPEHLHEVVKIDSIYFEFEEIPTEGNGKNDFISGVNVFIKAQDPAEDKNYYKWGGTGLYKIVTQPELFHPPGSRIPLPKECCDVCYTTENIIMLSISNDRLYDGNSFNKRIMFLEDNGVRFIEKYILKVRQQSLSKNAFDFYALLKNQMSIDGDIFDPPPAKIRGNIIGITNSNEDVVGYFTASDVFSDTLVIKGVDLPYVNNPPVIADDCRVLSNSTTNIPDIW